MALVSHVTFLGLLRFGEVLVDVLVVYERSWQIIAIANALMPGGLGGEACHAVEVADGLFDAGDLVHVVDGFC